MVAEDRALAIPSAHVRNRMSQPYTVRVHPRARHVRLRLDPRDGLIVTVPARFDQRRIPGLLEERRDWIEQVSRRHAALRADCAPALLGARPRRVDLAAMAESWTVDYQVAAKPRAHLRENGQRMQLVLPTSPATAADDPVAGLLRRWLSAKARMFLGRQLGELAEQHGFRYRSLGIRYQRSRWGSCSARGNISLNARLMFCPPRAVRYVLIHELVHTEHLNHSPAFWSRVAELMPDYSAAQHSLKQVWQRLPDWA